MSRFEKCTYCYPQVVGEIQDRLSPNLRPERYINGIVAVEEETFDFQVPNHSPDRSNLSRSCASKQFIRAHHLIGETIFNRVDGFAYAALDEESPCSHRSETLLKTR